MVSVTVLADKSADFLVDIILTSRDASYSHSIQCVLSVEAMFMMSSLLFSLHSVLRTVNP
jgi:hypothetical protein